MQFKISKHLNPKKKKTKKAERLNRIPNYFITSKTSRGFSWKQFLGKKNLENRNQGKVLTYTWTVLQPNNLSCVAQSGKKQYLHRPRRAQTPQWSQFNKQHWDRTMNRHEFLHTLHEVELGFIMMTASTIWKDLMAGICRASPRMRLW